VSAVTETHEEKLTLAVDVEIPGHAPRGSATPLFIRTKKILVERVGGRCFICNGTEAEIGAPLKAHHFPVERSLATAWDWPKFIADCRAGKWGVYAQAFHWEGFDPVSDPYKFVDDMRVNGLLLCAKHHRGADEGIHGLPHPLWIWQKYAPEGYEMSNVEIIHDFT
jgi:hypothetical protein